MPNWVKGLDIAFSRISREWAMARRLEGYRVFVQNLWTGGYENNDRLREVAAPNLEDAMLGGLIITGYSNASPWHEPWLVLYEARLNAGRMWDALRIVAIDAEIPGLTAERVEETALAFEAEGKLCPIYTARWFWAIAMGNSDALAHRKLWNAYYDYNADVDFGYNPYGGWTLDDVIGEQYQGTTNIDGVDVDLNVFDLDYWGQGGQEEMTDEEIQAAVRRAFPGQAEGLSDRLVEFLRAQGFVGGEPEDMTLDVKVEGLARDLAVLKGKLRDAGV